VEPCRQPLDVVEQELPLLPHRVGVALELAHLRLGLRLQGRKLFLRQAAALGGFGVRVSDDLLGLGPRVGDELLGLGAHAVGLVAGVHDQLRGFGLRCREDLVAIGAGSGRDLLSRLSRLLEDRLGLLGDLLDCVPDGRLGRLGYL
jgi:hypothetical protein